jgi:hypothetical protein
MSTARTIHLPQDVEELILRAARASRRTPEEVAAEWLAAAARERGADSPSSPATAAYTAEVVRGYSVPVPAEVMRDLRLRAHDAVRVTVSRLPETPERRGEREAERAAAREQQEQLRQQLSGVDVSLTEALIQARDEEDAVW